MPLVTLCVVPTAPPRPVQARQQESGGLVRGEKRPGRVAFGCAPPDWVANNRNRRALQGAGSKAAKVSTEQGYNIFLGILFASLR